MKLLISLVFLFRLFVITAPASGEVVSVPDGSMVYFRPIEVVWGNGEVESFELFIDNPDDAQDVYIIRGTQGVKFELAPNKTIVIIEDRNTNSP